MQEYIRLTISFIIALAVTYLIIPLWIEVCNKWKLFDFPDTRKLHAPCIPTMGGLAIFAGIFISFFLLADIHQLASIRFIVCASLLLFFTGFFDDLLDLKATKKLFIQIVAAFIVVCGGSRIGNLSGIIGLHEIPVWSQYLITIMFVVSITNAYNLIDGIDGLAGGLGLIGSLAFGFMFLEYQYFDFAVLSFCISGSMVGFLIFNFHPAKIFMGDTGSLLIGFLLASLAVNLLSIIEIRQASLPTISPAFIAAVMFIPVYDIFRVLVIRLLNGDSPFKADRNHLHYMILRQGFTHRGASIILCAFNLLIILLQFLLTTIDVNLFILLTICIAVLTMNNFTIKRVKWVWTKLDPKAVKKSIPGQLTSGK